jgi:hypothetical protein
MVLGHICDYDLWLLLLVWMKMKMKIVFISSTISGV